MAPPLFKRILVPIDPAKPFAAANKYAVDLAHRFESRIVATYVIDENLMGPSAQTTTGAMDEALEWVGRDAMDDFAGHHTDLDIQKTLAYGSSPTALFQTVLQCGVDLLVLGGYHTTNMGLWGSIAGDIVHHCERSCFVVRRGGEIPKDGEPIVVPYDGSLHPRSTLEKIVRLAKETGASIDLVYVASKRKHDKALSILKDGTTVAQEAGVQVASHVLPASRLRSKARIISAHAHEVGSPLVAVSRIGHASIHTGRSRTVGWLIAHCDIPVWVVRR